jgi:mono/diheme cytochrome c family protein
VPHVIGTIVFVLLFITVGLSVVLAAMRSGRGPAGSKPETRATRRAWGLGIGLIILVIGLGLPALVLAINGNDHAKRGPGGVDLTASQAKGRELFVKNCATCHTLAATHSVGRVGPNLDQLNGGGLKAAFVENAIKLGRARGAGQMPANLVQGVDARDVAEFVSAVSGR